MSSDTCGGMAGMIGDGLCDDATNVEECLFDGGDCCKADTGYFHCTLCECLNSCTEGTTWTIDHCQAFYDTCSFYQMSDGKHGCKKTVPPSTGRKQPKFQGIVMGAITMNFACLMEATAAVRIKLKMVALRALIAIACMTQLKVRSNSGYLSILNVSPLETCTDHHSWIGDGFCDDETNTDACLHDGGDCCLLGDFFNDHLCSECFCHVCP